MGSASFRRGRFARSAFSRARTSAVTPPSRSVSRPAMAAAAAAATSAAGATPPADSTRRPPPLPPAANRPASRPSASSAREEFRVATSAASMLGRRGRFLVGRSLDPADVLAHGRLGSRRHDLFSGAAPRAFQLRCSDGARRSSIPNWPRTTSTTARGSSAGSTSAASASARRRAAAAAAAAARRRWPRAAWRCPPPARRRAV